MKKPKKPIRKAARRAKRDAYDPCDPTAIPASMGMEQHLAERSSMTRIQRFENISNPDEFFEVVQTVQNPYEPCGTCETCGRPRYKMHWNVTMHPESLSLLPPEGACECSHDDEWLNSPLRESMLA